MKKTLTMLTIIVLMMVRGNAQILDKVVTLHPEKYERGNFYLKEFLKERPWVKLDTSFQRLVLKNTEGWTGYGDFFIHVYKNENTLMDLTAQKTVKSMTLYTFSWVFSHLLLGHHFDEEGINVFFVKEKEQKIPTCVFVYKDCEAYVWHISATKVPGSFVGNTDYYSVGDYDSSGFTKSP